MSPLFFVPVYIIVAFAKTVCLVATLGLLHGVVIIPVCLAIMTRQRKPSRRPEDLLGEQKENMLGDVPRSWRGSSSASIAKLVTGFRRVPWCHRLMALIGLIISSSLYSEWMQPSLDLSSFTQCLHSSEINHRFELQCINGLPFASEPLIRSIVLNSGSFLQCLVLLRWLYANVLCPRSSELWQSLCVTFPLSSLYTIPWPCCFHEFSTSLKCCHHYRPRHFAVQIVRPPFYRQHYSLSKVLFIEWLHPLSFLVGTRSHRFHSAAV